LQKIDQEAAFKRTHVFKSLLSILFPSLNDLDKFYRYAKKRPVLLPVAWIHRMFHSHRNISKYLKSFFQLTFSSKRAAYLKKIGLIK
jgi:hypothetical protein